MQVDVLIFGGGAAGLWLLDELARRGDRVLLLEAVRPAGQTIASQGIIHGGLKYTLQGAPDAVGRADSRDARALAGLFGRPPAARSARRAAAGRLLSFVADRFARLAAGDDRGPRRAAGRPASGLR